MSVLVERYFGSVLTLCRPNIGIFVAKYTVSLLFRNSRLSDVRSLPSLSNAPLMALGTPSSVTCNHGVLVIFYVFARGSSNMLIARCKTRPLT